MHTLTDSSLTPPFATRALDFGSCIPRRRHTGGAPLGPLEGFVFSRIDGRRSVDDIAALVGLSGREVFHVVARLCDLRVCEVVYDLDL